jgi:geranylgeranyl diphosphate synthase type I
MEYFGRTKPLIEAELKRYLSIQETDLSKVNAWGGDLCGRLYDFTARGKMIRGGLVLLAHDLFGGQHKSRALSAAVAMELIQSAFLIHDDIMDRDTVRRGRSSIFQQYREKGDLLGYDDSYHFGESLGICAGDSAFFMGFGILSSIDADGGGRKLVAEFCAREVGYVGLAQMQDVSFGHQNASPPIDEILKLYGFKTGRYTFSMPLALGAMIADGGIVTRDVIDVIEKLGEYFGLIFQIKDDEIGLFGDGGEIGKVVGSDIRENKKSVYRYHLFKRATTEDRTILDRIFGKNMVTDDDVALVREMIIRLGIKDEITKLVASFASEAERCIDEMGRLPVVSGHLDTLRNLLSYSISRTR